jgi:translation initiation factor IF-3
MNHQEFGHNLIAKFKTDLQDYGSPEGEAKLIGRRLILIFTPVKKSGGVKNEKTE